jgi:hypothetical protein
MSSRGLRNQSVSLFVTAWNVQSIGLCIMCIVVCAHLTLEPLVLLSMLPIQVPGRMTCPTCLRSKHQDVGDGHRQAANNEHVASDHILGLLKRASLELRGELVHDAWHSCMHM